MEIIENTWIINPKNNSIVKLKNAACFSIEEISHLTGNDMIEGVIKTSDFKKAFGEELGILKKKHKHILISRYCGVTWFEDEESAQEALERRPNYYGK